MVINWDHEKGDCRKKPLRLCLDEVREIKTNFNRRVGLQSNLKPSVYESEVRETSIFIPQNLELINYYRINCVEQSS